MPFYASVKVGDLVKCGCSCSPYIYGFKIILTLSGVVSCGCVGGVRFNILSLPAMIELNWDALTSTWFSIPVGSGESYNNGCADFFGTGQFTFTGTCTGVGKNIVIVGQLNTSNGVTGLGTTVFTATFTGPHQSQPNAFTCAGDANIGDGSGSI